MSSPWRLCLHPVCPPMYGLALVLLARPSEMIRLAVDDGQSALPLEDRIPMHSRHLVVERDEH